MTGIIKVDTIQNNGGTTGLTIDSSGRVFQPAKPAFMVGQSSITSNTPNAVIPFDETILDQGSNFSLSDNRFNVPVTGIYHFHFHSFLDAQNSSSGAITLRLNGGNNWPATGQIRVYSQDGFPASTFGPPISLAATVPCTAGDNVDLYTELGLHNNYGCYFGGYLVG